MRVLDLEVISDPQTALVALEPIRSRLLSALATPASAAGLASRLKLARQKLNYHLKALEQHRLVQEVETRKWGGLVERLLQASAASYVISPMALGEAAPGPDAMRDRLSASYVVALGARIVREVGELSKRAHEVNKRLATLAMDTELCFGSAAERQAFAAELTEAVASLVARYHHASASTGRSYRLVLVAHPLPHPEPQSKQIRKA